MKNTLLFATLSPTCMIVKFAKKKPRAFSSPLVTPEKVPNKISRFSCLTRRHSLKSESLSFQLRLRYITIHNLHIYITETVKVEFATLFSSFSRCGYIDAGGRVYKGNFKKK